MSRIAQSFQHCKSQNRAAFIPFMTAGDPDFATSLELLRGLPEAGADIIEIGMPFSDPVADGPVIQRASRRALTNNPGISAILKLVRDFRAHDNTTPIVLMGYFNPVFVYGPQALARDAAIAGVDGILIVDLPPEESGELQPHLKAHNIDMIRMVTPTTDADRLPAILSGSGGFLYCVAVAGVTGTASAQADSLESRIAAIRQNSDLPVAIGFGISNANDVRAMSAIAEGVVVGSALVGEMERDTPHEAREAYISRMRKLTGASG
jgi:tryptophan synthase alpha chain